MGYRKRKGGEDTNNLTAQRQTILECLYTLCGTSVPHRVYILKVRHMVGGSIGN